MRLLKSKVALVPGAARGMGRAIAETSPEHGAHDKVGEGRGLSLSI